MTGMSRASLSKLQKIQHAAARLITGAKKAEHIRPILKSLHWLPVHLRVKFKLLLITFKALHGDAPIYIKDLLSPYQPGRELRSSKDTLRLHIPTTKLKTYGDRSFSHAAPTHWNNLDVKIRSSETIHAFKTALKKLLFESYYQWFTVELMQHIHKLL